MMQTGELVTDVGSVLDGKAAVEEGLIDSLGGLSEAIEALYELIESSPQKKRRRDAAAQAAGRPPGRPEGESRRPTQAGSGCRRGARQ